VTDGGDMGLGAAILLAVGLAMDSVAVAAARGLASPAIRPGHVARVALLFGGFQALMPLLGWQLGARLGPHVARWDHWIASGLLVAIGGKMLRDAWRVDEEAPGSARAPSPPAQGPARPAEPALLFGWRVLILLAIATSIDAFAAGITLPLLGAPLIPTLALIGGVTALLSAVALLVGRRLGAGAGRRLDALGGLVLIGLGVKILLEHTWTP
jgi:manganese efflux pump family protein